MTFALHPVHRLWVAAGSPAPLESDGTAIQPRLAAPGVCAVTGGGFTTRVVAAAVATTRASARREGTDIGIRPRWRRRWEGIGECVDPRLRATGRAWFRDR